MVGMHINLSKANRGCKPALAPKTPRFWASLARTSRPRLTAVLVAGLYFLISQTTAWLSPWDMSRISM